MCLAYHLEVLHSDPEAHDVLAPGHRRLLESLARSVTLRYRSALDPESYRRLLSTEIPALDPRGAEVLLCAVADQHTALAPCADRVVNWIESDAAIGEPMRLELLAFLDRARAAIVP
ncbi:MAG: hypothetical protein U5K76_03850 [Woeseiaceae bacterium]|nr:hypothetical protein [Woeseiaceae bacterium]